MTTKTHYTKIAGSQYELKTVIWYDKADQNSMEKTRGYYVSVYPVEIIQAETSNGVKYNIERSTAYSGYKALIKECKRFNAKEFEAIQVTNLFIDKIISTVFERLKIQLTQNNRLF